MLFASSFHDVTWPRVSVFSRERRLSHSIQVWVSVWHFYPLHFQCWGPLFWDPFTWTSGWHRLLWTYSPPHPNPSFTDTDTFAFSKSLWLCIWSPFHSSSSECQHSPVGFSTALFTFGSLPALSLCISLLHFHFRGIISSFDYPLFYITSSECISGALGNKTTTCHAVCVWTEWQMHSDRSPIEYEKGDMIDSQSWWEPLIYLVISEMKTSSECVCVYIYTHTHNYLQLSYPGN